jgi:hypothetical protein
MDALENAPPANMLIKFRILLSPEAEDANLSASIPGRTIKEPIL